MKVALKNAAIFFLILFILSSCQSILVKYVISTADIKKNLKVLRNKTTNQTIVFFPMVHVGKKEYYDNCKILIDSLRNEGYLFFYESVSVDTTLNSTDQSKYNRKFRSILGYNPLSSSENKSIPFLQKSKNIMLQDYNRMGLKQTDKNLDLKKNQIIDSIEKKFGEIKLTDCDYKTGELDKYNCKTDNNRFKMHLTNIYRDPYIASEVLKMDNKKIVLIYGKMHWYGIYPTLKQNGFEITKGKI